MSRIYPPEFREQAHRSEVDGGRRPGITTEEQAEIRRLKKENTAS